MAAKAIMPTIYRGPGWAMELATDWQCDFIEECFTIFTPDGVGVMQISVFGKDGDVTDEDLLGLAAEHLDDDVKLEPYSARDFEGFSSAFAEDGEYWQYWFMGCADLALFITYNCEEEDRNVELKQVRQMVNSLEASE